jgi:hypothetical protein
MPNDFKKPIGKWIEEEEQVDRVVHSFDPTTRQITQETVSEAKKVRVIYEQIRTEGTFCQDLQHEWMVLDSHKYTIKCKKCPMCKTILVGQQYIDQKGHVRSRGNDRIIA